MSRKERLQEKMEIAARYGQPIDPGEEAELRRLAGSETTEVFRTKGPVEFIKPDSWMLTIGSAHKPPNAFHRLMQRIFFGFKWRRVDD